MSLEPGEEIGMEVHGLDQFIRVEKGSGKAILDGETHVLEDGSAIIVPAGANHNIVNTSTSEVMKLYTLYSPPNHILDTLQPTKADEREEHFDGRTSLG
jgi:mannose-6-phosphate isomerase-like protein (cupin superfamily)